MPVAIAAISVDGRCRERSPADIAIFGETGDRFLNRFENAERGQALLAAASSEGASEGCEPLHTPAGAKLFRVALWRQRKGDRIRIVGAFAAVTTAEGTTDAPATDSASPEDTFDVTGAESRHVALLATALRPSLAALLHKAERLRADAQPPAGAVADPHDAPRGLAPDQLRRQASDILAAGWRLMRLADELVTATALPDVEPAGVLSETDPVQLLRRIAGLNRDRLASFGAKLDLGTGLGGGSVSYRPDRDPLDDLRIIVDESRVWSAVEGILWCLANGVEGAARLTVDLAGTPDGGAAILVRAEPTKRAVGAEGADPAVRGGPWLNLAECAQLLASSGTFMETESGRSVRVRIPPARCIGAL